MIIPKPISCKPEGDGYTTRLFFEGRRSARFYMRGAIGFPEVGREGFALLAGQNVGDRKILIFEELPFWTVEHWEDRGGIKERETGGFYIGLVPWMADMRAKYGTASYFWGGQHREVFERYSGQVYKSHSLPSGFELIEVLFVAKVGDNLIDEYDNQHRLGARPGTDFERLVSLWRGTDREQDNNGVHALRVLLAGLEECPWVDVNR